MTPQGRPIPARPEDSGAEVITANGDVDAAHRQQRHDGRVGGRRKALSAPKAGTNGAQCQVEQERKKLQNLIAAIESGSGAPSSLLKAVADREATIKRLEAELRKQDKKPSGKPLPDLPSWVGERLQDLTGLLKSDPAKAKAEFRRLSLQLTFHPTEAEPRAHYIVKGQCDLGALVFFFLRSRRQSTGCGPNEGAIGPQPHPSFIDFSCNAPVR